MVPKKLRGRVIELGHEGHQTGENETGNSDYEQRSGGRAWIRTLRIFAKHVMAAKLWVDYVILNLFV